MKYKKGQIVPRFLVGSVEKKSSHLVKFGCDVLVSGKSVKALTDGCVFIIPSVSHVQKKKRQRTVKGFSFTGISIESSPKFKTEAFIHEH